MILIWIQLTLRIPLWNISTELLSHMIGLDIILLSSEYILIFLTRIITTAWSSLVADTADTLWEIVPQVGVGMHHLIQVIR